MESDIAIVKNVSNVLSKQVFSAEREVWRNSQYSRKECIEILVIPASVEHRELKPTVSKVLTTHTAQKMKFSIKDYFSKCDQIRSFLPIWSDLLKKSLMENFIFCVVYLPFLVV